MRSRPVARPSSSGEALAARGERGGRCMAARAAMLARGAVKDWRPHHTRTAAGTPWRPPPPPPGAGRRRRLLGRVATMAEACSAEDSAEGAKEGCTVSHRCTFARTSTAAVLEAARGAMLARGAMKDWGLHHRTRTAAGTPWRPPPPPPGAGRTRRLLGRAAMSETAALSETAEPSGEERWADSRGSEPRRWSCSPGTTEARWEEA